MYFLSVQKKKKYHGVKTKLHCLVHLAVTILNLFHVPYDLYICMGAAMFVLS